MDVEKLMLVQDNLMHEDVQDDQTSMKAVQEMMEPKRRYTLRERRPFLQIKINVLIRARNDDAPDASDTLE